MRFLPVFLDLQAGPVLLIGAGDAARAKLRLLTAAPARVRWYATDGDHDLDGFSADDVARIERVEGDPLAVDLTGLIAIVCAGADDIGPAMSARARAAGLPVNVMDDPSHSTFIFPAIVDRGDVVVAVGTGGASPVVARRVREMIEAVLPARIGDLAGFIGRWRKAIHARIPITLFASNSMMPTDLRLCVVSFAGREVRVAGIGRASAIGSGPPCGSPRAPRLPMTSSTVAASCITHASRRRASLTTCAPSPCDRLSRPLTTTGTPSP